MKNFLFSICFLFVITINWSCQQDKKTSFVPGDATVKGTIIGIENQMVFVKDENPLNTDLDTVLVDGEGTFSYTTHLEKPKYISFEIDGEFLTLYMRPNDQISFTSNHKNFFDQIKFDGGSSVYNNYMVDFSKSGQKFQNNLVFIYLNDEKRVSSILDSIKNMHHQRLDGLTKSFTNIDDFFVKSETKRIDYEWGYRKITYPLYHKFYSSSKELILPPDYESFLNILDKNDSSSLQLKSFRDFIDAYYYTQINKTIIEKLPYKEVMRIRFRLMAKSFQSQAIVDYLCYDAVKNTVISSGLRDADEITFFFDSICKNEIYRTYIQKQYEKWNHLRKGQIAKDFTFVSATGDSIKLSDFKGKYIFLDVWATWCKPCLEQLPFLHKLQADFKSKKIVFISISVDQDKKVWLKSLKDKQMGGIQLYAGRSDVLYNYYLITGIPRFILIDKDGKFVESSCQMPSNGVEKILTSLEGI